MENIIYIVPLFFLTALVYASVGFGGGSTYLALLVLFSFPYLSVPKVALLCNLIVVTSGVYHHTRAGNLSIGRILPFVVTSIPFAYWGGTIPIEQRVFLLLLGFSLAVAGLRLLFGENRAAIRKEVSRGVAWSIGLPLGALLGFLSGLVGIGGGIFLGPILYLLGWGDGRQIAASTSLFIFANSLFGLWGQFQKDPFTVGSGVILPLGIAVLLGGQIGSRWSVGRIPPVVLQRMTALLVLFVSGRILWGLL